MEKGNKMAEMLVKKLMLSMSVPIIISMLLQAFYNIVDSAFVSNMKDDGEAALNALTLAFPMQVLMIALGVGTGVGANVVTARCLGQKDHKQANKAAGNAVFMAIVLYAAFLLFGLFGAEAYIKLQTSNSEIAKMGTDYLRICCIFSFGIPFYDVYEKLLQATGHSLYSTIAQITGAALNIILDPILIYGLLGFPAMGVKGAAYATVIGQISATILAFIFHLRVNKDISNKITYLKPRSKTILDIYAVGFPAIVSQALISVMTYGINIILGHIGEEPVTAFGLYYKIWQFLMFAAFGMRDAIMPITAFAYGMGKKDRVREAVKYGHFFTAVIMLIGTVGLEIFAAPMTGLFKLSGVTENLCISAMHIITICFVFSGVNIAFQGVFQALGSGLESLIISVCRQALFVFPFAMAFAHFSSGNISKSWLVWFTFPIAEILTAIIAVALYKRILRTKLSGGKANE